MSDLIAELLDRLEKAKGDTHAQSVLAAEFALATLPEAEREPLRSALDVAAVLRWFDVDLLEKMLDIPHEKARRRFDILKSFPFIERYRSGDRDLRNVHESTRLGWRKNLHHA